MKFNEFGRPGSLHLFYGPTASGKTLVLTSIAEALCKHGKRVAYFREENDLSAFFNEKIYHVRNSMSIGEVNTALNTFAPTAEYVFFDCEVPFKSDIVSPLALHGGARTAWSRAIKDHAVKRGYSAIMSIRKNRTNSWFNDGESDIGTDSSMFCADSAYGLKHLGGNQIEISKLKDRWGERDIHPMIVEYGLNTLKVYTLLEGIDV